MGILNSKSPKKLTSQWLSPDNRDYCFNDSQKFKHPPKPLSDYPGISNLLEAVNSHESTTHNLDAAFILGYNNTESGLNFHHDGEKLIDQASSIATVSFGNKRSMEFCCQGGPREPQYSFDVKGGDLAVMKPGCQQVLLHRICPGSSESSVSTDNWRFSISFRKVTPVTDFDDDDEKEISFDKTAEPIKTSSIKPKLSIIAGDSYTAGLDPVRLGRKNRKIVKNLSEGGATIEDVCKQLDDFYTDNKEFVVEKVFISVGTNDIRYCKDSGVSHLRNKLLGVVDKVRLYFPGAKLFFQSLLPLPVQNVWTVTNIESYNKMLYDVCSNRKAYFINCFSIFLAPTRSGILLRDEPLFMGPTNIHPNNRGLALMAKKYLFFIHNRKFNPLAYN